MISIICPVTDNDTFDNMLVASLKKQAYPDYELLPINAKKHGFRSAAETLNYGAKIAKGDIFIFVHQDVELLSDTVLSDIVDYSSKYDFAIAGVCGVVGTGEYIVSSSVTMGPDKRQAGIRLTKPQKTFVLDECLFVIKANSFTCFDNIGDTWHFYAVDYCLRAHKRNENVYLFPLEIYHLSPGWSLNYDYFDKLKVIGQKYTYLKKICTCMGIFRNDAFLPVYCNYRKFKLFVKIRLKGKR